MCSSRSASSNPAGMTLPRFSAEAAAGCCLPRYLTKENGFIRWQFGADNVLSIKGKETELLVLDDWSGDPTLSTVKVSETVEGRQARLLALLDEIVNAVTASMEGSGSAAAASSSSSSNNGNGASAGNHAERRAR